MTNRCPLTDLPTTQCGCPNHHKPTGGVISAAALERIIGRPAPEYRTRQRINLDTPNTTLTPTAQPLDRVNPAATETCQACGDYPRSRDKWICDWCAEQWEIDLLNADTIAAELDTAIAKQTRMTSNAGGSNDNTPLPFNPAAAEARAELTRTIRNAHRQLVTRPRAGRLTQQLLDQTRNTITRHPDAPELVTNVRTAIRRALAIIDRPRPTLYLGPCPTCQLATHITEGTTTHTCPCGQIIIVAQALADRETAIADVLVTWQELLDARIAPRSTLYWWRKHHHLEPVTDWNGHPMYRLGDAKELANTPPET